MESRILPLENMTHQEIGRLGLLKDIPPLKISIIIPAYNEEHRLGQTIKQIIAYMEKEGHDYEIIVVDDGSIDRSVEVAKPFSQKGVRIIRNDCNRGKGYTVRHGMLDAQKPLALFSDADLSTPIEELEKLVAPILAGNAQVAIGSRAAPGAQIEIFQPFYRVAMGKIFNLLLHLFALGDFYDTQCGFKLFTRQAAQAVFRRQRLSGFSFDVEILAIARSLGFQIAEVPVRWIDSSDSKVRILRDSSAMLFDLFKVRWNTLLGRYR